MKKGDLVMMVVLLCGGALASGAAQQAAPRKKPRVLKPQPAADYVRCIVGRLP